MLNFTGNTGDFSKIGLKAASRGDVDLVRQILKAKPNWVNRPGPHGRTMLWEAAHRGRTELVKYLVGRRNANVDACGTYYTPYFVEVSCFCIARYKKHDHVADYLLRKQAVVDIHTAAFLGELDLVKRLLRQDRKLIHSGHAQTEMAASGGTGPDYYPAPAPWATPLCYALRGGDVETVRFLISRQATIQGLERTLFIASDNDPRLIRLLLENGANPATAPRVQKDDGELYDIVTSFGGKAADSRLNSDELVYLCRGDRGGNPVEVKRLLRNHANVNHQDHKGKTALHRAAKAGFVETMQVLLDHQANVNITDPNGETAIYDAVRSTIKKTENQQEAIRLLIKMGANLKHTNHKGLTPFDVASHLKSPNSREVCQVLQTRVRRHK